MFSLLRCGVVFIVLHSMAFRPLVGISLHRIVLPCIVDILVHSSNLCSFPVKFIVVFVHYLVLPSLPCITLHRIALPCITLHRIALPCTTLCRTVSHCIVNMKALTVLQNNLFKKNHRFICLKYF